MVWLLTFNVMEDLLLYVKTLKNGGFVYLNQSAQVLAALMNHSRRKKKTNRGFNNGLKIRKIDNFNSKRLKRLLFEFKVQRDTFTYHTRCGLGFMLLNLRLMF